MNNWREEIQPEWPAAAFGTQGLPVAGETATEGDSGLDDMATRALPVLPGTDAYADTTWDPDPGATWPETLRSDVRHGLAPPADQTEVLPAADPTWGFPQQSAGPGPDLFDMGPGSPRDPWQQDGHDVSVRPHGDRGADPDVDPHEVTVQLDAVQLGEGLIRRAASASAGGGRDVPDGPVFVDESGRRSRLYRRIGMAVAVACAVYAVVIVATLLSGSSDAPWLPVPGQKGEQPVGQVDTTPVPDESALPTGTGSPGPGGSASPGDSASPLPGTSAAASGVPAAPDEPGTSTGPQPTETRTTSRPGTGGAADPAPTKPTPPPEAEDPDPAPTGPTADPTETAGDGGPAPAADTLAAGPAGPAPVAVSSREEQGALSSQSPESFL